MSHLRPWWSPGPCCCGGLCLGLQARVYVDVRGPCYHQSPCGCPWSGLMPRAKLILKGYPELVTLLTGCSTQESITHMLGQHSRTSIEGMGMGDLTLTPLLWGGVFEGEMPLPLPFVLGPFPPAAGGRAGLRDVRAKELVLPLSKCSKLCPSSWQHSTAVLFWCGGRWASPESKSMRTGPVSCCLKHWVS